MKKQTLTVETPFGTFTRETGRAYRFAAVGERVEHPEGGVLAVGNRKGDPELATSYEYTYTQDRITGEQRTATGWTYRTRYHIAWSTTEAGAVKNCEGFPYDRVRCLGVYPVG